MMILDLPEQKLVRLRADPEKIRVSWRFLERRDGGSPWCVKLRAVGTGRLLAEFWGLTAEETADRALEYAESLNIPGIDNGMAWAYEHPWKKRGEE